MSERRTHYTAVVSVHYTEVAPIPAGRANSGRTEEGKYTEEVAKVVVRADSLEELAVKVNNVMTAL